MDSRDADVVLYARLSDAHAMLIETPGLAEIVLNAAQAPEELSAGDRIGYLTYQEHFFNTWEIGWFYHVDGILTEDTWRDWDEWFAGEARRRPLFGWTDNRHNFPALAAHVDSILAPRHGP